MTFQPSKSLMALAVAAASAQAVAQEQSIELPQLGLVYEEILVTGGAQAARLAAGSASFLDEESITQFDQTDLGVLVTQVPGVYVRSEDGYGLRPNIGIRGAAAERSQKITIMEDGILITPAPYAAPAAYYVPNINRMNAVEVFKGPSAIEYGPHTVGGALNLVTQPLPGDREGEVGLSYGSDGYHKERLKFGDRHGQWAYQIDGLRYGADGFKDLDGGGDTGFIRNDINLKVGWESAPGQTVKHSVVVKLGFADETSDETYLGLTDADFEQDENRRYISSAEDEFNSEHYQAQLLHTTDFGGGWRWSNKIYTHRFDRSWNKLDGFLPEELGEEGNPFVNMLSARTVLAQPEVFSRRLGILRGEIDSDGSLSETIDITDFDREYGSEGIETSLTKMLTTGGLDHNIKVGFRYHNDYVERNHPVRGYLIQGGELVADGEGVRGLKALNRSEADAYAFFVRDEIKWGDWKLNLGLRGERIEGEFDNDLTGTTQENTEEILIPGGGVYYQFTPHLGLLAGVNKGFSPNGPGTVDDVDPEESVNYEYGLRYQRGDFNLEAIGFFSDYENLLGRCRVSDPGCQVGDEFNGGSVEIGGLELTSGYSWTFANGWRLPVKLVYTYTESAFQSSFESDFSQFGNVRKGDELPYMPEHQGRVTAGLETARWNLDLTLKYQGESRELPGRGEPDPHLKLENHAIVDLSGAYRLTDELSVKLVVENITDRQEIVSRRPLGARPNQPRTVQVGATYRF